MSVLAPKYDEDIVWDEFPLNHDDVLILEHNVCNKDVMEEADLEKFVVNLAHKSSLLLHGANYEKRISEFVDTDPQLNEENET